MQDAGWLRELLHLRARSGALHPEEKQRLQILQEQFTQRQHWDAALQFFWQQLDNLEQIEGGWELCYDLISRILLTGRFSQYATLTDTPQEYIQNFVSRKIFEPASRLSGNQIHCGALQLYYRNYLRDEIRALNRFAGLSDTQENDEESSDSIIDFIIQPGQNQSDSRTLSWQIITQSGPDLEATLREADLTVAGVRDAAREFLASLATPERDWARILLKCCACADSDLRIPVAHFHGKIKNHNYRARQLGIIAGGSQFPRYRDTVLGQWLLRLKLTLSEDERHIIEAVLKILSWEALSSINIDCEQYRRNADISPAAKGNSTG